MHVTISDMRICVHAHGTHAQLYRLAPNPNIHALQAGHMAHAVCPGVGVQGPGCRRRWRCNARFTLADPIPPGPMPRLCPELSEANRGVRIRCMPGPARRPCRTGTPCTLADADAPSHCRPIWNRSRVHYMTPFPVYLFDSSRTCFVQHLRIQSFTHTLLFVFVFLCSSSSS